MLVLHLWLLDRPESAVDQMNIPAVLHCCSVLLCSATHAPAAGRLQNSIEQSTS
jgi:hypothetical protein